MKLFLLLLAIGGTSFSYGQNLVINGDFEDYKKCPKTLTGKKLYLKGGLDLIHGTPDYFNACSKNLNGNNNPYGPQKSQSGNGHIGLMITSDFKNECAAREYIQLKLSEPLIAGHKYELSFFLSLANKSGYYTDQIGAIFTETNLKKDGVSKYIGHPHVNNTENDFLSDTIGWIPFSQTYNAMGGEEYVVIGNFQKCNFTSRKILNPTDSVGTMDNMKRQYMDDLKTNFEHLQGDFDFVEPDKMAYYFVDNVQLTASEFNDSIEFVTDESKCNEPKETVTHKNLLHDPGFDLSANRKNEIWNSPTKGTPDFEHGHAGVYLYSGNDFNNREYIISKLDTTLNPCNTYAFKFRIKRSGNHKFAVDKLGVAFSDTNFFQQNRTLIHLKPAFETNSFEILENTTSWTQYCDTLTPNTCGNYIVIGNFSADKDTYVFPISKSLNGSPYAHYLIDDVELYYLHTRSNCVDICAPSIPNNVDESEDWLMAQLEIPATKSIYFSSDQYLMDSIPTTLMTAIKNYLKASENHNIGVTGHSDSSGRENRNVVLSKRRARSIYSLLLKAGIPEERISMEYVGSKYPVESNETVEGRAKNRRVEIQYQ